MKTQLAAMTAILTSSAFGALSAIQTDLAALGNGWIAPSNPVLIGTTEVTFVDSNGTTDRLLVIDSTVGLPLGGDPDLAITPSIGWGVGIQENPGTIGDDERRGGSIDMAFVGSPESEFSWQYGDTEEGGTAIVITESGATVVFPTLFTGNALASPVQTFSNLVDPAVGVRFELGGSGMVAIDAPAVTTDCFGLSCIPEVSGSLMMGIMFSLGGILRRRR